MAWHPDVPDLPIKKPKVIEKIEKMDPVELNSLPGVEVQELVDEVAHAVAKAYKNEVVNGNIDECEEVISIALSVTGSAIGGQVGLTMIAESDSAAEKASAIVFPNDRQ